MDEVAATNGGLIGGYAMEVGPGCAWVERAAAGREQLSTPRSEWRLSKHPRRCHSFVVNRPGPLVRWVSELQANLTSAEAVSRRRDLHRRPLIPQEGSSPAAANTQESPIMIKMTRRPSTFNTDICCSKQGNLASRKL
jgi:hypothetical protein